MNKQLIATEVAEILRVSYGAALDFIKYSGIQYKRIGRRYLVDEDVLTAFLSQKGTHNITIHEDIDA